MAEQLMTRTEYAERRGVSQAMIVKYEHMGLLVFSGDKIDAAATDAMLEDNLDPIRGGDRTGGGSDGGDPSWRALRLREQHGKVLKLEMENAEKSGTLVKRDEVDRETFTRTAIAARELLQTPDLCAALVPEEQQEQVRAGVAELMMSICRSLAEKAIRPSDVELLEWLEAEAMIVRARIAAGVAAGEQHA